MGTRHMASFAVHPSLIQEALHMPEGHQIVGAEWDFVSNAVRLYAEGPDLPEVDYGQCVPSISPVVTTETDGLGGRTYIWSWNANKTKVVSVSRQVEEGGNENVVLLDLTERSDI